MMIPQLEGASDSKVFSLELPALHEDLTSEERHVVLLQHDTYLSSLIDMYFNNNDYTLIYTTTSVHAAKIQIPLSENEEYQAELPIADMMRSGELRRSLAKRKEQSSSNQTAVDGPLFDKYQFLSPGMFLLLFFFVDHELTYIVRHLHGSLRWPDFACDRLRGHFGAIESPSHLWRV